jgi:hypothetical protein
MISIEIDPGQLKRLQKAVKAAGKLFSRELAAAVNSVSKKTRTDIGRKVRSVTTIKKKASEEPLKIRKQATSENASSVVGIDKTRRLGLRHFGGKQTAAGVSYKISKTGSRQLAPGAFQGPRPGVINPKWKGNAFRRVGKDRKPIIHIRGVSAFGAFAKNNFEKPQAQAIRAELAKQMDRRIKLNILRANKIVSK